MLKTEKLNISDITYSVINILDNRYLNLFDSQEYILKCAIIYVLENNKSNTLPYHNFQHTIKLVQSLIDIITHEPDFLDRQQETNFCLLLAGIFHDYNHSGGIKSDSENIQVAIEGLETFLKKLVEKLIRDTNDYNLLLEQTLGYLNEKGVIRILKITSNIIKATEYPFVVADENLTIPQKYIRDADMSSIFTDSQFQTNVIGLHSELKNKFPQLTLSVFCEWQEKFLTDLLNKGFYTDYYNNNYTVKLNQTIKFVSYMKEIFKEYSFNNN